MWAPRILVACLLLISGAQAVNGQQNSLRIFPAPQPITPLDIAEDEAGNLWIAAPEGVFRFDGTGFDRIQGEFTFPTSVAVLGGRSIFVGARNGGFQYRNGITTRIAENPISRFIRLSDNFVLLEDSRDHRWAHAAEWDGTKLAIYHQREQIQFPWLAADGRLWQICGDSPCSMQNDDALREAARKGELKQFQLSHVTPLKSFIIGSRPLSFLPTTEGWYAAQDDDGPFMSLMKPGLPTRRFQVGGFTKANGQPLMYPDREGRIWMPGDDLWMAQGGSARRFKPPQLQGKQVTCTFQDSRGRMWFGLSGIGLAVMGEEPVMETWGTSPLWGEVNALTRQNTSVLFAATHKGMLLRKDGEGGWREMERGADPPLINQVVNTSKGKLFGLIRFGQPLELSPDGQILRRIAVPAGTRQSSLQRLATAPDGTVFVGGQENRPYGLYKIIRNEMQNIALPKTQPEGGHAQDIAFDPQGIPFVAFDGGVCRVEADACVPVISPGQGLISPKLRGVGIGPSGEIWVTYREARAFSQFRYSGGTWSARHFTEKDGFSDPETTFIRRDRRGWVWRGSDSGVWVSDGVHVEPEDWIQIGENEGLPSNQTNRFGFLEDTDGSIWIGTASGIAHIKPSQSWFRQHPSVRISAVTFGQESFPERTAFPSVFRSLDRFTARFAGSELLPVRYRLLPRESNWRIGRGETVSYPKLNVGRYRLQATSGQGNALAEYAFEVTDPARTRARAEIGGGLALVGIGALEGVRRWRRKRRERARKALPDLASWRLAALGRDQHEIIGRTLGERFRVGNVIARGGFGTVFECQDLLRNCLCAIKILNRESTDEWVSKRFAQEVAALESITHPNVVRIYGHGTVEGSPYLVMEFVEGQTLRELLKGGALPLPVCARLLRQAGDALQQIHQSGIHHRDLKPENIMLRIGADGGSDLVLIDFSTAVARDSARTMHGFSQAVGTMHYMAPEQIAGYSGAPSDIYSFAKVAIEMMTGERVSILLPDALIDLPKQAREFLTSLALPLSAGSIQMIASALEFDPTHRPKSAASLAYQLAGDLDPAIPRSDPSTNPVPLPTDA